MGNRPYILKPSSLLNTSNVSTIAVVFLVISSAVAIPLLFSTEAGAVASPRTSVSGPPPVVVFQGESIDVTNVGKTTGGTIGPGEKTFIGIAGAADGAVESGSASPFRNAAYLSTSSATR